VGFNIANAVYEHQRRHPDRLAISCEGQELSYGELAQRAGGVAGQLSRSPAWAINQGFRPRVGILASQSIDACTGLLGASWAGGTYIPISLKSPEERLLTILEQCQLAALICDNRGAGLLSEKVLAACPPLVLLPEPGLHASFADAKVAFQDLHAVPTPSPLTAPVQINAQDLAYIIFTSGTTGLPKGVMIPAGAIEHYVTVLTALLGLDADDRVLDVSELSFDFSVHNMLTTWQAGASLHILRANRIMNVVKFAAANRLTVWNSVPSLVGMLKQIKALQPAVLPDIRLTIMGAEPLPTTIVDLWQQAAPNSAILNLYGPTEVTISASSQLVTKPLAVTPQRNIMAIGTPHPGLEAAIMTADRRLASGDQPGELALSGPQLAAGYLNADDLTAARFPIIDGKRWYLTGDQAFCDAAGRYHHLGRLDNQVKILGHRVELEEIETHLRELSEAELVAAVVWPVTDGTVRGIVAFVAGSLIQAATILTGLRLRLPAYSIPSRIIHIEQMPVTPNGKQDRGALLRILESDVSKPA